MPDINQINVRPVTANENTTRPSGSSDKRSPSKEPTKAQVQSFQDMLKKKLRRDEDDNGLAALPAAFPMSPLGMNQAYTVSPGGDAKGGSGMGGIANAFIQAAMHAAGETLLPAPATPMLSNPDGSLQVRVLNGQLSGVEIVVAAAAAQEANKRNKDKDSKDKKVYQMTMTIYPQNDEQRDVFKKVQREFNPSNCQLDIQIDPHNA